MRGLFRLRSLADGVAILALCGGTVIWSLIAGKDVNWDQLNYHFYSAYAFLEGRLAQDYMPANLQSYFNPLPYVPFYGMVHAGWHSAAIVAVLASIHAFNIALAYRITREITAKDRYSVPASLAGAGFAALSPVFLLEAGTTFADVSTSILVLLGVLLLLTARESATWWRHGAWLAGLALGTAAGLKLSNAVFAPAFAVMLLILPMSGRGRLRATMLLALGGVVSAVITHGYWSYLLWKEFGNPFFPLFNAFFTSPDYPAINHKHERFLPDGVLDLMLFPFRVMSIRSWVHVETVSPDLRYAALCLIFGAGVLSAGYRLVRKRAVSLPAPLLCAFTAFFIFAYVLWMYTSGNGRYGIVVSLLVGPMLAGWGATLLAQRRKTLIVLLGTVALLQIAHLQNGQYRWTEGHWTAKWYDERVPPELAKSPYLYLSIGPLSNAYIAPFLNPQSAFINAIGQMSFGTEGPGSGRVRALLQRYAGKVRMLSLAPSAGESTKPTQGWVRSVDTLLTRFSMRVDEESCLVIETDGANFEPGMDFRHGDRPRRLMSCVLMPNKDAEDSLVERRRVQALVDQIIEWCPKMFKPAYALAERSEQGWFANFSDSDMMLRVENSTILMSQTRSAVDINLGQIADWERGQRPGNCAELPRQPRKYYNFD